MNKGALVKAFFVFFLLQASLNFFSINDFFVLSAWRLFGQHQKKLTPDIFFPEKNKYLFRDYSSKDLPRGLNPQNLYYNLNSNNFEFIKKHQLLALKNFCQCNSIVIVQLQGLRYENIIEKKDLIVAKRYELQ